VIGPCLLLLLLPRGGLGQRRPRRVQGRRRPPSRPPYMPPGGAGGGLEGLLQGVDLNLLDGKFIGLGFVRQDLVDELCLKATMQLVREGEQRAQREFQGGGLVGDITDQVEAKCAGLLVEGEAVCSQVLDMIGTRFAKLEVEAEVEAREQCEAAKKLTVDMVVAGAEGAYNRTAAIGTQLAEAEFFRQVETEKNRGERMFQSEVEKNRGLAEKELRRRVAEGRQLAEKTLQEEIVKGKQEGERVFQDTLTEERAKAEQILKDSVLEGREQAEEVFAQEVAKGRAEAERLYAERAAQGTEEGEKICTQMINVACQNSTEGTDTADFCEEFFFFTDDFDERRRKRQNSDLYSKFYYSKFHN